MLADAAPPIALIALGSSLSLGVLISNKVEMVSISMLKVFFHPILVALAFLLFPESKLGSLISVFPINESLPAYLTDLLIPPAIALKLAALAF